MEIRTETIRQEKRAVIISCGPSSCHARLYVNVRDGIASASITNVARKCKTLAGAQKWANRVLA